MYKDCIICKEAGKDIELNSMKMKKCPVCGLIWRQEFNLTRDHYKNLEIDLSKQKLEAREKNCMDRIKTFKKYINLDNLCDIGTGEGIFLKVLKNSGYKKSIGIEPGQIGINYAKENNLNIIHGFIDDFPEVKKNYNIKVVTLFHVLEHLANPKESIKLVYENLNNDDYLVIETPNIDSYTFKRLNYKHHLIYPEHLFYFNNKNLKVLLKNIGFNIIVCGKRDFNQNYLSLEEIFLRLGLIKKLNNGKFFNKLSRKPLIYPLSKIIQLCGRLDYQWLIVQK